jgi:phage gp29-like protein
MTTTRKPRATRTVAAATPEPMGATTRIPELGRVIRPQSLSAISGRALQPVSPGRISTALRELDFGNYEYWSDMATQMRRDPVVRRAYSTRRSSVAGRRYAVEMPPDVAPEMRGAAQELVELTKEWLNSLEARETFLMRVLDGIGMGISVHELVWSRMSGAWMPQPVPVQTRNLRYAQDWTLEVRDFDYQWYNTVNFPAKFLTHVPWTDPGRPMDQGDFLACVFYWMFKRNVWTFWLIGAERFGNPLVLAQMAASSDSSQRQRILDDLQQLTADSVGVTSGTSNIEVISPAASGSTAVWKELRDALNQEIFVSLGVSPDLYLSGANGSRSSTETRDGVRLEGSKLDATLMWGSITRDVVRWLAYSNLSRADIPMPVITTLFDDTLPITADAINVGAVRINEVRASLGLPAWSVEDGGEDIAEAAQPAAPMVPGLPVAAPAFDPNTDLVAEPARASDTALNGAQVEALMGIVAQVATGQLPRASGVEIMVAAFPISREDAERIMGAVGQGFVPSVIGENGASAQPATPATPAPAGGPTQPATPAAPAEASAAPVVASTPATDAPGGALAGLPFSTSQGSAGGMPALSMTPSSSPTSAVSPTTPKRRVFAR